MQTIGRTWGAALERKISSIGLDMQKQVQRLLLCSDVVVVDTVNRHKMNP